MSARAETARRPSRRTVWPLLALAIVVGVAIVAFALLRSGGGEHKGLFSARSVWNVPLTSDAPLDPASDRLVGELNRLVADNVTKRTGPWMNTNEYSVPVYTVPASQPTVRVALDNTDPELQAAFAAVPIPPSAQPAAGTDKHMVIYQPSRDRLWEFWITRKLPDGWHAQFGGAMNHVSRDPGFFTPAAWPGAKPNWGASASSLPLLAGLIRLPEARAAKINHALAIALPEVRAGQYSAPAERTDGNVPGPNAIPEGAHLRLDPHLNVDALKLPPLTRAIAKAAQTYGIIVRDKSGVVAFYGEDAIAAGQPNAWNQLFGGQLPSQQLQSFPWKHLQLLRMQLSGG